MKIKSCVVLLLCMALCLGCFAACGSGGEEKEPAASQTAAPDEDEMAAVETPGPDEHPAYGLYYDYISSVIIPEKGLANIERFEWIHSYMKGFEYENYSLLEQNGCFGLVAASIYDVDYDGSEDMLAFYLDVRATGETFLPILEGRGGESFVLSAELYSIENGVVVLKDVCQCVNIMDTDSWGRINVYLERMEDGIYIYSSASAIDYTTEGFTPHTLFHISDGKFVFDYISGLVYGQGSMSTNPNIIMGTTNMNPAEYTIYEHLEQTLQLRLSFIMDDGDAGAMVYEVTENTGLRKVLEQGAGSAAMPELPQGGLKPEPEYIAKTAPIARGFAEYVAGQSGCVFVAETSNEGGNRISYRFETEEYSFLSISFDSETYRIAGITVSNGDYPVDAEWYAMKDAVIDWPELGLDRAELDFMYGSGVSTNAYTNGVDITGANVAIRQISGTDFVIKFYIEEN